MTPFFVIALAWLAFIAVWFFSALKAKRTLKRGGWFAWVLRLVVVLVAFFFLGQNGVKLSVWHSNLTLAWCGALCAALGVAFAIWARAHIAENWGMPMSVKENPELVTTGPYSYVRHPIYTGVLLAMLGTSLAAGWPWLILFITGAGYFFYSATKEEKLLMQTFPSAYPAYRVRTKMLIPFVL